jgi:hypothetical protein
MPAPTLIPFAQRLYDRLLPLQNDEANNNYALAYFLNAIATAYDDVEILADVGPAGQTGWSILVDINRIPDAGLPWLGQFIGVQLIPGLTAAQQRYAIQHAYGWNRGTPAALTAAIAPLLTGNKTVIFKERDGDPYTLTVITRTAETPSSSAVLAALLSQKPGGIILNYLTSTGFTYLELRATQATYTTTRTNFATYTALRGF